MVPIPNVMQGDVPGMLSYCQKVALSVISSPGFRNTVSGSTVFNVSWDLKISRY